MRRRRSFSALGWISVFLLIAAVGLTTLQFIRFSRLRLTYPPGMKIADVPVGNLTRRESAQRLLEAYSQPVELRYDDEVILLSPSVTGFELDLESMLAAADLANSSQSFWEGFWDYLWGRQTSGGSIPLRADYSEERLRTYLRDEIAARYDKPPSPAIPQTGTVKFTSGSYGTELNINQAVLSIDRALFSVDNRSVTLPRRQTRPPRPSLLNLETLLKQTIDINEFDGIVGFYLFHPDSQEGIHFAYQNGQEIPTNPDVSFTTASIVKIPIMVSIFRRIEEDEDPETLNLLQKMIVESGNDPADWVMERVIHPDLAPLEITEDMQSLGLENTFLAGEFSLGSPLLKNYSTPANQRTDVSTDPDPYNQSTPSDMGMLLEDILQCADNGEGTFKVVFPEEITQEECQLMIDYLARNRMPSLIEAGVPDVTEVAHKHGWVTTNGIMQTLGDAGIVFSPGGEYILVIFLNHPQQLIWDNASNLVGMLSEAVYNYYNQPLQ
ncbi:MAG: serine hydrolase [Anaerolineales bacterium]|nr:serine hydrolase [Anaerolineales bacterium]